MTDRVDQIEVRIAFLEQANTQLSDALYAQQQELQSLRAQLSGLLQRLEAQSQPTTWEPQDEKPPHY